MSIVLEAEADLGFQLQSLGDQAKDMVNKTSETPGHIPNWLSKSRIIKNAVVSATGLGLLFLPGVQADNTNAINTLISNLDRIYGQGTIEGTMTRAQRWVATPGTPIGQVRADFTNGFAVWDECGATDFVSEVNPSQPITYRVVGFTQPIETIQPYAGNITHEPAVASPDEPIPANGGSCPTIPGYPYGIAPGTPLPPGTPLSPGYFPTPIPGTVLSYLPNPNIQPGQSSGNTNINNNSATGGSVSITFAPTPHP